LRVLVFVIAVARGAARLLDVCANHGDNRVVGHAPLTRTVIVQNVTKPKLALLLHQRSRENRWRGKGVRKSGGYGSTIILLPCLILQGVVKKTPRSRVRLPTSLRWLSNGDIRPSHT